MAAPFTVTHGVTVQSGPFEDRPDSSSENVNTIYKATDVGNNEQSCWINIADGTGPTGIKAWTPLCTGTGAPTGEIG